MKEKYSFKDFLTKESYIGFDTETEEEIKGIISKIEIPMIQRDYAQGRIKEYNGNYTIINDTGSRFIRSIFNVLKNNSELELEFIYGSIEERPIPKSHEKEHVYIPLDGQQRLTTLFLLYWYFSMRELSEEHLKEQLIILGKFTYLTRSSSRIFCKCICDYTKMEEIQMSNIKPSLQIENCHWFYKEYKKDPTVKAMLAMIDYIDLIYRTEGHYGNNYLSRLENLKFYAFPLNKYNLTEDLYIKMNARGKQLSSYENFKADLISWMKNKDNPESLLFYQDCTYRGRSMKYFMAFAQKMDNEWTDIFWNVIKHNLNVNSSILAENSVDAMFMRFFMRCLFNERILHLQKTTDLSDEAIANDDIVRFFYGDSGNDSVITYNNNDFDDKYRNCLSYDIISRIESFLDNIIEKLDIINAEFTPSWLRSINSNENSFYSPKISWQSRIVFLATFNYFSKKKQFNKTCFSDWIRVVWNFVVDPTIRNIKDNIGTLKFIDDLSIHSEDIIKWLANTTEGSRLKMQFAEEHIKAQLITKDPEWRKLIIAGEKHPLLKGRIMFLLSEKENTSKEAYRRHLAISQHIIPSNKNDYLWLRAILSRIEKYNIQAGPLILSDIRENWKTIINDNLMNAMQSLLVALSDYIDINEYTINDKELNKELNKYMQELCHNYQKIDGLEWVYPIVTWQTNDETLLNTYTDSRKIEERNGYVYLCYKTTLQTDSCILLTCSRDKIISKILPMSDRLFDWSYKSYQCNIRDCFFRGMIVTLFRDVVIETIGTLRCAYSFSPNQIIVGIRYSDNPVISTDDNSITWACSKIYDISQVNDEDDINSLIARIENEVFNIDNVDSLLSKAENSQWENEVDEVVSEENNLSPKGLSISFPTKGGKVISNNIAVQAFKDALVEIGLENIPQVGVMHSGYNLVSKEKRPGNNWQHEVDGWYIYVNINNDRKREDLIKISNYLHLNLYIE